MRTMLLTSVAALGMAFAPVVFTPAAAQTGSTQTPPAPNASSQMPQPLTSAPAGAATPTPQAHPSGALGGASTPQAGAPLPRRHVRPHPRPMPREGAMNEGTGTDGVVPPTTAYRGGVGSPLSTQATDLNPSRGEKLGSRLPMPPTAGETPHDLLAAAQTALNRGQTGAAQQALEMAETRVLSRTTDPSMAGQPDQQSMVMNIGQARRALGARDIAGAKAAVAMALNDRVPPRGPATVSVPGVPGAMPMGGPGMAPMPPPMPRTY